MARKSRKKGSRIMNFEITQFEDGKSARLARTVRWIAAALPGRGGAGRRTAERALIRGRAGWWRAILMAALAGLVTGCVGVLPIPSFSRKVEAGQVLRRDQVAFIVPGQTSLGEITNRLGGGFRDSGRMPALAYSWELAGGRGVWWAACEGSFAGEFEWSHWRAFFVLFDERGVVIKTKFARLSGRRSLDEQLEQWAAKARARQAGRNQICKR